MTLLDCYYKDYVSLWNQIKNSFIRQFVSNKPTNYLLKRDSPGNDHIPYIEISEKLHKESPLLIVGMNPSGADVEHYENYCKGNNIGKIPDVFTYCGNSPYYKAMEKFASDCLKDTFEEDKVEHKYSELDLFGIVQSTQTVIQKDFLLHPEDYIGMFDLFLKYVKIVNPKVIIVANAFVRKVLLRDKDLKLKIQNLYCNNGSDKYKLDENNNFGGYRFKIDDFETQLYFSSMLSGQRALDLGSRENLVWLVRNYLKNNP